MNKSKAIFASLALVAVALAPLALAHNNPTAWALDPPLSGVKKTDGANRTSGVYYKDVSALVAHTGGNLPDPDNTPTSFTLGLANALCDMEVLSDGSSVGSSDDETEVDAVDPAGSAATLFDDGGVGAVCHTHQGYYDVAGYNTPGCDYNTPAKATDVSTRRVWLATQCDYAHSTAGVGLVTYLLGCLNNVFTNPPVDAVTNIAGCATDVVDCFADTTFSCPLSTGQACGGGDDGTGGVTTNGQVGWSDVGVAFDDVPSGCSDYHGAAAVFVWTAVVVDSVAQSAEVSAPTVGAIF